MNEIVDGVVQHPEEPVVEQKQETPEYTEIQIKAIEQGWIPKEEFDGDESEFIDAAEFVRRGELFKKIETQNKELRAVRQALEAFRVHHSKVKEMEYERALKSLKDAKREATVSGDHERALALEDKIEEVRVEKDLISRESAATAVKEPVGYTPEFQEWVNRNSWYETNRVMRAAADKLGKDLYEEGNSPPEVLRLVEAEIRKEFNHKLETPTQPTASRRSTGVDSSTRQSISRDTFRLTPEEEQVMRQIISVTPGYTEADYKREIKAIKGR